MPTPTAPARIGRYQTRISRIVDILASHVVTVPILGQPGKTKSLTIWTGLLYKADGKSVDTLHEWEASGAFRNQRGVSAANDLALFMRELTPDEIAAGLEKLPASAKPAPEPATPAPPPGEGQRAINLRRKRRQQRRLAEQQVNAG